MEISLARLFFVGTVFVMSLSPGSFNFPSSIYSTKPCTSRELLDTYEGPTTNRRPSRSQRNPYDEAFVDPRWKEEWYMMDYRTTISPVMDHNTVPVYKRGFTGFGVVIAVLGDGIKHDHEDLQGNVLETLNYDACIDKEVLKHTHPEYGTQAAGIIAMVADNDFCGVGIAFQSRLIGVNLMCGKKKMDFVEGRAFNFKNGLVDIYNILRELDAPFEKLDIEVFKPLCEGIRTGRNKKGAIYIVSSGNNKKIGATCASDSLVNHYGTIAIARASREGKIIESSERCTAVFATAYTGFGDDDEFVTTSSDSCIKTKESSSFVTGPAVASGIIALALHANNLLTYRDVMHLMAASSEVAPLADNKNIWYRNGAGFWVSNDFGFGLLNAENLVSMAEGWQNVQPESICTISYEFKPPKILRAGSFVRYEEFNWACKDTYHEVNYVEIVEVVADIEYPKENALTITLWSPTSYFAQTVLASHSSRTTTRSISGWSFKSIQNWGENPRGKWAVYIIADKLPDDKWWNPTSGYVKKITLMIHGTRAKPAHYRSTERFRRTYSTFRTFKGKTSFSVY